MSRRPIVPFLHLIDADGTIATPLDISRYLASTLGADPFTLTALQPQPKGRSAPSIPELRDCGFGYRVVGVFGGQSSGKSTLLNHLFGTQFETMNSDEGRLQTTKGCFLGKAAHVMSSSHLYVMDFEGTDGVERGENQSFEKQLSLFALSVADTLIVNMWANEVGRFNAANLSLLQTVFEVNLQLMAHEQQTTPAKPTLLFVLRDHTDGPLAKLEEVIVKSLKSIWDRIGKPPVFSKSSLTDFFKLAFCALPHYKLQRAQFDAAVSDLQRWFCDPTSAAYLYRDAGRDNYRLIALDDVSEYLNNCWQSIKTVRDLDIPSQREMLALVRCAEIVDRLVSEFEVEIKSTEVEIRDQDLFIPNITHWIREAIEHRMHLFSDETRLYTSSVVSDSARDLLMRLESIGSTITEIQCERLCAAVVRESGDSVQGVLDMAFHSVLPRLATEWYGKVEAARSNEAAAADKAGLDPVSKNLKIAEAQRSVKASHTVKKFWDFIAAELDTVTHTLQGRIAGLDNAEKAAQDEEGAADASTTSSSAATRALDCLRGDPDSAQRTLQLVERTLIKSVRERLEFVASDLSASMTKTFERHLAKNDDGSVRFITTQKALDRAFGPARAAGLLLAACCMVLRLPPTDAATADVASALSALIEKKMYLEFDVDEQANHLIGVPVYPEMPSAHRDPTAEVKKEEAVEGNGGGDPTLIARRVFLADRVVISREKLLRAYELYSQHTTFTYAMQKKQIDAGGDKAPAWMWGALLLLGANEIWWVLTNPLILILIGVVTWIFFRSWVESKWQQFEETAPPQVLLPVKALIATGRGLYEVHVAPLFGPVQHAPHQPPKKPTKQD